MENTSNNMNMSEQSSGNNKKPVLIAIILGAVVLAALVWWFGLFKSSQQVQVSPTPDAETAAINQDINGIDVGDLNAEFEAIDKDLLGL